jgi:hypothetical protein
LRDPDLILRAQVAAAELERAWDRWRTMHGLGTDPLPPVSSYVGYSLEEPWGQPRVVFGIEAREAEHLAALLDRHDCAGPVYASVASLAVTRSVDTGDDGAVDNDHHRSAGRVRVPTQARPGAAQRERQPEPSQPEPQPELPAQRRNSARDEEEPRSRSAAAESREHDLGPEAGQPGPPAFRPRLDPGAYPDDDQESEPVLDAPEPAAEPSQAPAGWTRASRASSGRAQPRQKRTGGAARGASGKQEGRDRSRLQAMAAELAGWAAGELPGQASH